MKIELNKNYKYGNKKVKVINVDPIVVITDTGGVYRCGEGDLKPIAPECPVEMLPLPEGAVYVGITPKVDCSWIWSKGNDYWKTGWSKGDFIGVDKDTHYCAEIDSDAHKAMEWYEPRKDVVEKAKAANNNFPAVGTKLRFKVDGFACAREKAGAVVTVIETDDCEVQTTSTTDKWTWGFDKDWQDGLEVVELKLEVGKYYKNRRGEVVGPLRKNPLGLGGFDYWGPPEGQLTEMGFREDGTYRVGRQEDDRDLISEAPAPVVVPVLPEGVSDPGDEWIFAGEGPVKGNNDRDNKDIAMFIDYCKKWYFDGNIGNHAYIYALRRGSPIHRQQVWFSEDQLLKPQSWSMLRKGNDVISPNSYDPYVRELLIKDGWKEIVVVEKSH